MKTRSRNKQVCSVRSEPEGIFRNSRAAVADSTHIIVAEVAAEFA